MIDTVCYHHVMLFGSNPEVEEVIIGQGAGSGLHIFEDKLDRRALKPIEGTWEDGFNEILENRQALFKVVCGVASTPAARKNGLRRILEVLGGRANWTWGQVLASSAHVGMDVSLGAGVLVLDMAYVGPQATLEDHVVLLPGGKVYHNAHVGQGSIVVGGSTVLGRAQIGAFTHVCANAVVLPEGTIGPGSTIGVGLSAKRLIGGVE